MSVDQVAPFEFLSLKFFSKEVPDQGIDNFTSVKKIVQGSIFLKRETDCVLLLIKSASDAHHFKVFDLIYVKPVGVKVYLETDKFFLTAKLAKEAYSLRLAVLLKSNFHGRTKEATSLFDQRTDRASSKQYFNFYSQILQQQNMMMDNVRTHTYHQAIINNPSDFYNKVVLDVGTGSGLLAFFAAQAGARVVYAVEASNMALHAKKLVENSIYRDVIKVIMGKIEEVVIPEKVDTIVSEPLGYMLLNERMLESYVHAKKFLNPCGNMYPSESLLLFAAFTDEIFYMNYKSKAHFWNNKSFYGIDLTPLVSESLEEILTQPIIDLIDSNSLLTNAWRHRFCFLNIQETDLQNIRIDFDVKVVRSGIAHGMGFWFEAGFIGRDVSLWLSTAPNSLNTHWYQVKILFRNPIFLITGSVVSGTVLMVANARQSYDVSIELKYKTVPEIVATAFIDLKTPYFFGGQHHQGIPTYTQPTSGPL